MPEGLSPPTFTARAVLMPRDMPGTGPVPSQLAVVSDSPLGTDLDHYLTRLNLSRSQIFCTTLQPLDDLWLELEIVTPDLVIAVGSQAMRILLSSETITLEDARGLVFDCHGIRVFPIYPLTTEASDPLQRAFLEYDFTRLALYLKVSGLLPPSPVRALVHPLLPEAS